MDFVKFNAPSNPGVNQWAGSINAACAGTNVPPCLLAAIVARETGGKNVIQYGHDPVTMLMPDGSRPGCGLCQITSGVDWSDLANPTYGGLDLLSPGDNLRVAVESFLSGLITSAESAKAASPKSFEAACRGQLAFAVACGYNAGWGNVERALIASQDADYFIPTTSGADGPYGADVLKRYTAFVKESHG